MEAKDLNDFVNSAIKAEAGTNPVVDTFLAQFLKEHEAQIERWISSGEGAIFDSFITILGGKSKILAALLTRYKSVVIAAGDQEVAALLDQLIAYLSAQQA